MTPHLENYLRSMSDRQREQLRRDSIRCLREAWPWRHRSAYRARIVIRANVTMLRNLKALTSR